MPFEQDHPSSHDPDVLPRGASIGRFVVLGLVGRGGMGDVYAAYDPELDRKIAVKLLRARPSAGQSTTEGRTRLLREAQAIAKLSHPNVVVVYDVGTFGEAVFIAMEFIDGDTVRYWLNASPRDWREVLRVFVAAGRGLAAAHDAGLVHRDFKPDNVMVDHDGKVRVMDFGLARQSGAAEPFPAATPEAVAAELAKNGEVSLEPLMPSLADGVPRPIASGSKRPNRSAPVDMEVTRVVPAPNERKSPTQSTRMLDGNSSPSPRALEANLTQTGAMLGTPAYMAPEQFASKPGDARTDQFSFCVALYESLYGERPFEGKSFMALMASVAKGVVREAPEGTKVPSWVRRVILRGLLPAAAERHPSMTALLDALEKDPSVAHRRWAAVAVTVMMAVGMVIGAARTLQARHSPCEGGAQKLADVWEPIPATTARKQAIHNAFVATGKTYAEKTFETVKRALDKYTAAWTSTYTDACEATAVRGEQSAEVLDLRMSCLQGRLDSVKAVTDLFAHADGNTVEKAASAVDGLGDLDRCSDIPVLRAVVKPPDDPMTKARVERIKPRLARVKALTDAGHVSEALALARPLAEEARATGYLPLAAQAVRQLAQVSTPGAPETLALAEEAIWDGQAGGDDEIVAEGAIHLTYVVGYWRRDSRQASVWSELADATLRRLGGHGLWRAWLVNNRGVIATSEGRYADALAAVQESVRLKEQLLGAEEPDVAISLGNIAYVLSKLKRIEEALTFSERALVIDEKMLGIDHPETARQLENRAELLNLAARFGEAEGLERRVLAVWEREMGAESSAVANALTIIGRSSLGLGNMRQAVDVLRRAYAIRLNSENESLSLAETEFLLAQALWTKRTNRDQALALALKAQSNYAQTPNSEAAAEVARWLATH